MKLVVAAALRWAKRVAPFMGAWIETPLGVRLLMVT